MRADRNDGNEEERRLVGDEIAARLSRDGVRLDGHESSEDLVELLSAVELFEVAVRMQGGDLMVDQPVGDRPPVEPDDAAFVLPVRGDREPAGSYARRIAEATRRVAEQRPPA
jgi:hypothetical protein